MGHDASVFSSLWAAGGWVPFCHHWNKVCGVPSQISWAPLDWWWSILFIKGNAVVSILVWPSRLCASECLTSLTPAEPEDCPVRVTGDSPWLTNTAGPRPDREQRGGSPVCLKQWNREPWVGGLSWHLPGKDLALQIFTGVARQAAVPVLEWGRLKRNIYLAASL